MDNQEYHNERATLPQDLRKTIDFEESQLPLQPEQYKVGTEHELKVIVKVIGEKRDLGEPHVLTCKVINIVRGGKKYKRHWIF